MKKKNLLLWGYYGANNFGDDLIFESLIQILDQTNQDYNVFYTLKDENYKYDVNAIPLIFFNKKHSNKIINFLLNIWFVFKTVLKMDIIIIGGGTQYFELASRKSISIPIKYLACRLMKIRGKIFINAGVGIGEIKSKIGKFCLKGIFSKSNYSFVRDSKSKIFLESIGVPDKKVVLGKDLSYYFPTPIENKIVENPHKIGLNFFDFYNYIQHDQAKNTRFIKDLKQFVSWLKIEKGFDVNFFAFQNDAGGKDYLFMQKHFSDIDIPIHLYNNDTNEFITQISSMDLNIGLRFHFAVLSLQHNIPFIGLNYQPKVERELKKFGLDNYILQMDETNQLQEKTNQLISEFSNIKLNIKNTLESSNHEIDKKLIAKFINTING